MQADYLNSSVARQNTTELLVPYAQLSSKLQQLNR
ncbi:hypothetical protein H6F96_13410 [Microcoleus sp. FACHB-53]|nr:hypothetical protein [Microcoleus sp. FACHB-53]MBD2128104.1 hypothetical protein [Microcoleus sp. FACHB-1]